MKAVPRYTDANTSRAIYPPSKLGWYITLLILSRICYSIGIFLVYDVLKIIRVVPVVCLLKLICGSIFVLLQKPLSSGKPLKEGQWCLILQHVLLRSVLTLLWFYGMSLCGSFRTLLVYEQYDFVIITGVGALCSGIGGPASFRGAIFFIVAIISLMLFDHDEGQMHPGNGHLFSSFLSWLGLADHKGGIVLLLILLVLRVGVNAFTRKAGTEIGGIKRLHALSTIGEGVFLIPLALWIYFRQENQGISFTLVILPLMVVAAVSVIDYYVDAVCVQRLEVPRTARIGSCAVFLSALGTAILWQSLFSTSNTPEDPSNVEEHSLSGGGIFSCVLFVFAALSLTSPGKTGAKGSFVGYSSGGLPLYNFTNSSLHQTSRSFFILVTSILNKVLEDHNSRKIFYFLCLNLSFTVVEFLYGIWTNSLGLISDGFHMLFDSSALVMGLLASVMARWKPSKTFSYGYSRVEDLSGFINGLFLLVISFFVFTEALNRLVDPPSINTHQLLTVSVAGLFVNLVGILAFKQSPLKPHSHSQHHHSHNRSAVSSFHAHGHSHNANMEGVFLHIMADTLGSVGVITSSILIEQFGWYIADPICSIFIAALIFLSVIPLLKHSSLVLLLRTPVKMERVISDALQKVFDIDGVIGMRNPHFWQHSSDSCVGTIHIQTTAETNEQKIIEQVTMIFKEIGFSQITVQVEKEEFFTHLSGLSSQLQLQGYHFGLADRDTMIMVKAV